MERVLLIHSSVGGRLHFFHVLSIMKNAAVNIRIWVLGDMCFLFLWDKCLHFYKTLMTYGDRPFLEGGS